MHVKYAKPLAPSRRDICEAFHEAMGAHIEADAVDHVVLLLHEELDRIVRETLPTYNEELSVREFHRIRGKPRVRADHLPAAKKAPEPVATPEV